MTNLVTIVPSRGRPTNAERFAQAFARTVMGDTALTFVVGEDDPAVSRYLDLEDSCSGNVTVMVTPAEVQGTGVVAPLNWAAGIVAANTRPFALAYMGDDHLPHTVGWDKRYLDELDRLRSGWVYGDDLIQGAALPTQWAQTTDIRNTLGWMALPTLGHLYMDDVTQSLGQALDRITYLPDVIVEHLHPTANKAPVDDTYGIGNSAERWQMDGAAYEEWRRTGYDRDVQTLREALQ